MGVRVARSAQDPSGGRLAGPRRASWGEYLRHGGGQGLRIAVSMPAARVTGILTASGLRDRGDPDTLLGTSWAAGAPGGLGPDGRLVVDASGIGPEVLRARSLIAQNPYAIVEGICIGLHATGFVRATIEVGTEAEVSERRLHEARDAILEDGWSVAAGIEVVDADEGDQALRVDVESVAHVAWIMAHGVRAFRMLGTAASPGTTLCTVVGDVEMVGVFEVPLGLSIGTLVRDVAGGGDPKVVHRGTSMPVLTADALDESLCFEAPSGGLGSGLFRVHDTSRSIVDVVWSLLQERPPSRCRDCGLAAVEMLDLLRRARHGRANLDDLEALLWRAHTIADDHRCAGSERPYVGVRSTTAAFVDEFVATFDSGSPTSGCLPPMPCSTDDAVPAITPRWCDSPRPSASVLVTDGHPEQR